MAFLFSIAFIIVLLFSFSISYQYYFHLTNCIWSCVTLSVLSRVWVIVFNIIFITIYHAKFLEPIFFRLLFFIRQCFKFYLIAVLICYIDFFMYRRAHNVLETLWWASFVATFVTGGLELGRKWGFGCSKNILISAEMCWGV